MFGGSFGMTDAMKLLTPFLMPGGDKMKAVEGLVKQFATDENIKKYSGKIIEGVAGLQAQHGCHYLVTITPTIDQKDIYIGVVKTDEYPAATTPVFQMFLSQLTQADILNLISLITSYAGQQPNTTATKRIG